MPRMPAAALPQYIASNDPRGALSSPNLGVVDLRPVVGAAMGIGNDMVRMQDAAQRNADEQARVWAGLAVSDQHVKWLQELENRKQQAVGPAANFTPDFLKAYDEQGAEVINSAPNDAAKQYLRAHLGQVRVSLASHALTFEAGRLREWKLSSADQTIDNAGRIVQQDPSQFSAQLLQVTQTMPRVDPASDSVRATHARSRLVNAAAGTQLERDPYKLQDATAKAMGLGQYAGQSGPTGVPYIDAATPEQVKHWNDQATVRIKQIEADQARAGVDAEKRARDAVAGLRTFMIEGRMPDPAYEADIQAAVAKFPELKALADQFIGMAKSGAAFGAQTLPKQQAMLEQMESEPTNPETAKLVSHARSVFTTQSAAAKANPWGAGSRFWRLPVVPEVQIPDPAALPSLVAQRVPMMTSLESATGKSESPLQPNEARQVADGLANTPIPQRTQILGQVGDTLKSDPARIEALAAQLGERDRVLDLTLKLAAERTGSGRMVAEVVQRGAQALSDKTVKKDDTALDGWRAEIADMVRGTGLLPKAEQDVIDSAYYVRAAQELAGIAAPGYSSIGSGAKAAIAMVAGMPVERAGVKFLIPRGMTESEFDTKVQAALKPMAGQTFYARGQPVTAESVAFRVGSFGMRMFQGGYVPVSNNAPLTIDKEGQRPLVLGVR